MCSVEPVSKNENKKRQEAGSVSRPQTLTGVRVWRRVWRPSCVASGIIPTTTSAFMQRFRVKDNDSKHGCAGKMYITKKKEALIYAISFVKNSSWQVNSWEVEGSFFFQRNRSLRLTVNKQAITSCFCCTGTLPDRRGRKIRRSL